MSACPPTAAEKRTSRKVRDVPKAAVSRCSEEQPLFHHLVSASEQRRRHFKAEPLGRGQIDGYIEFGGLFHGDVARLCAAHNLVHVVGSAPKQVREVCSVGH